MAQNITLLGANYSAVPAVQPPKTGGGTATFTDVTDTTAAAADVSSGKYFYTAAGVKTEGTASGGGSSKNVQIAAGVNRVNTTSYTKVSGQSLTVAKTGTYDVYWSGFRSSTSGTSGSRLYIDDSAYGSAQTTFSTHGQSVHLSNVSLTQGQVIAVRARARSSSYYMYVANLTIVES